MGVVFVGGDDVDDGAADDYAVGDGGYGGGVGAGGYAEADDYGASGVFADFGDVGAHGGGEGVSLTSYAFAGDVVDEASGGLGDELHAGGGRSGGNDEDGL